VDSLLLPACKQRPRRTHERCSVCLIAIARLRSCGPRAAPNRPTQQRAGEPSGASALLLCQEAGASPCAPGRPSRKPRSRPSTRSFARESNSHARVGRATLGEARARRPRRSPVTRQLNRSPPIVAIRAGRAATPAWHVAVAAPWPRPASAPRESNPQ
jgi:hypothetical protein